MKAIKFNLLFGLLILTSLTIRAQTLEDGKRKKVSLSDCKGKVLVLDFWFTGCINCMNFYRSSLSKAEEYYKRDTNVVFMSVNVDRDRAMWLKSLANGRYASKRSVNLFTEGLGAGHPLIKLYRVSSYPQVIIISKKGKPLSRPQELTKPGELIKSIKEALNQQHEVRIQSMAGQLL
jgi:cytochrome oxidase Cu insertion factor (SCO1/SenC/PrrC family)